MIDKRTETYAALCGCPQVREVQRTDRNGQPVWLYWNPRHLPHCMLSREGAAK